MKGNPLNILIILFGEQLKVHIQKQWVYIPHLNNLEKKGNFELSK